MQTRLRIFGSLSALSLLAAVPAYANQNKAQNLVDKATLTVQDMFAEAKPDSKIQRYIKKARAVMVCPSVFQMSIVFGGSGGKCLLLSRDARGSWSDPAFYNLSTASFGIQLGIQDAQMMMFVMTDRGLQALMDSQFHMGAGASASIATYGEGIESGTTGEKNTDIAAVQKSKGAFAGASLNGTKLSVNSELNRAYYKHTVGPEDIVINMRVHNPGSDPLRGILTRLGGGTHTKAAAHSRSTASGATSTSTPGSVKSTPLSSPASKPAATTAPQHEPVKLH